MVAVTVSVSVGPVAVVVAVLVFVVVCVGPEAVEVTTKLVVTGSAVRESQCVSLVSSPRSSRLTRSDIGARGSYGGACRFCQLVPSLRSQVINLPGAVLTIVAVIC